jgi:hypothetical protein
MTFTEVTTAGVCAVCRLPSGLMLRYEPADGSVRSLAAAAQTGACTAAPAYDGIVPACGWSHPVTCARASCCAPASGLHELRWPGA